MATKEIDFSNPVVMTELIRKMIDATPIAYLIVDRDMRIQFANEYFLGMRGVAGKDVVGGLCYDLTNDGKPCRECLIREAFATGDSRRVVRKEVLQDGTERYVEEYAIPLKNPDGGFEHVLEMMMNRTNEFLLRENNSAMFLDIMEVLISILEKKDPYTSSHSNDVTEISTKLGRRLGLGERELFELRFAALVHDLGKVYIPDEIINKPDDLTEEEMDIVKRHPEETMNILAGLNRFANIRVAAGHHHERWDGGGYPASLEGDTIPFASRIIALADSYDAMTSERPYRPAMSHDAALREIHRNSGKQFDPLLTGQFLEMASREYPNRQAMVSEAASAIGPASSDSQRITIVRRLTQVLREPPDARNKSAADSFPSAAFAQQIMNASPANCMVMDREFNILFASDNVARDLGMAPEALLKMRCFELTGRSMECFEVEQGRLKCPVVRAFKSGRTEHGDMLENINGEEIYRELYAVPLELRDKSGDPLPCLMEISINRTREYRERMIFREEVGGLLDMIYGLARTIDPETTGAKEEIVRECESFSDFLERMRDRMRRLTGTRHRRKETVPV